MTDARRVVAEHMDDPAAPPAAIAEALRFIRGINRWTGGASALLRALDELSWPADRPLRLLDVGTGSADLPEAVLAWARRRGRRVRVVGVDRHPATAAIARARTDGDDAIEIVEADATALGDRFAGDAFDVAHAGMFLHHLDDATVEGVLAAMGRLAGVVIWNDLLRGPVGRVGVRLLALPAPAMVRHDAVVSVDAGFTRREVLERAGAAGLRTMRMRVAWGYRFIWTGRATADSGHGTGDGGQCIP